MDVTLLFCDVVGSPSSDALADGLRDCRDLLRRGDSSDGVNHFEGNITFGLVMLQYSLPSFFFLNALL